MAVWLTGLRSQWGFSRGGGGYEAMVLVCLRLAAPIGLLPLHIPTLCRCKRVLVVSTEPRGQLSRIQAVARAVD